MGTGFDVTQLCSSIASSSEIWKTVHQYVLETCPCPVWALSDKLSFQSLENAERDTEEVDYPKESEEKNVLRNHTYCSVQYF